MAVWGQKWYIIAVLISISLGHWSLLLHGILLTAAWIPGQGCVITSTDSKLLSATFIYSMVFDFTVLILTAFKLIRPSGTKSRLVNMMFSDGLYYFIIAYVNVLSVSISLAADFCSFLANLIATVCQLISMMCKTSPRSLIGFHDSEPERGYVDHCERPRGYRIHRTPLEFHWESPADMEFSQVAASRVVRRLANFSTTGAEMFS